MRPIFSLVFPKLLRTSANRSNANTGNKSWGKNLKAKEYSTTSSRGYRDIDSIHVTKDVELSVTAKPHERRESDSEQPLRGAGREEWSHPEWNYRT